MELREEASEMLDGQDDEHVLVMWQLTNAICEWGEILVLLMRNPSGRCWP